MRKYRRLTRQDRIIIQRRLEQGKNRSEIADELGVCRSTISREIKRNKSPYSRYKWLGAHRATVSRIKTPMERSRKIEGVLEEVIIQWLSLQLSPQQISCRLKMEQAKWRVSHETIYRWIYNVAPQWIPCLRWGRRTRRKRSGKPRRSIQDCNRKMIDARPMSAEQRSELGHWERDLLLGKRSGPALLVLQDRKSRYVLLRKIKRKNCKEVTNASVEAWGDHKVLTATNDNGAEFRDYTTVEQKTGVQIFFCHPYTSSERGSVENINGLIRQYIPKGFDLRSVSSEQILQLQDRLNNRPKKILGYRTPSEVHLGQPTRMVLSEHYYRQKIKEREIESMIESYRLLHEFLGY